MGQIIKYWKFGIGEARNCKFGTTINHGKFHFRDNKIPQKKRGQGTGQKFETLTSFGKFGTGEARNFIFGTRIDLGKSHFMDDKTPKRGMGRVQRWNF